MNYLYALCLLSALLFFPCTSRTYTDQDTEKQLHNQPITRNFPDYFFNSLLYSENSVTFFLKKIYNDKKYPQYFLSHNFTHVIEGINFAHESDQPRFTIEKIFSLFHAKLDNIYVNPYAFSRFLCEIHPTIARYCNRNQEKYHTIELLKECMGSYLIDNYATFKQDPDKALEELAHAVHALTVDPQQEERDISVRELQHTVYRFISHGLSQLIWNPADQLETWHNVKRLSCQLEKLTEYYIIDTKMLDSLLWTLLNRYSYFICLVAKDLTQEFFNGVREDLQSEKAALWLSEEKESYITTKLEHLTATLLEAEITSQVSALANQTAISS
ncbi:hypothetical protein H0W26_02150 [Candidatus Dependentiae bacterium]|nr:hypothetical protein [Candidatus Dependentiae bacterium]